MKRCFLSMMVLAGLIFLPYLAYAQQWAISYGGPNDDEASSISQTSDGGYIVAGRTESFGAGNKDFWVLKLNSDGSVAWQKSYGGTDYDVALSISQTSDDGYIVAGVTESFGAGSSDFWILKLNSDGSVAWQKSYGGPGYDGAFSISQTSDGGYIVAGLTASFGAGGWDFWILKLNSDGSVAWQKSYGGPGYDGAFSISQTSDGGYIVAGLTASFGAGDWDFWILKLNSDGSVAWQKSYGGPNDDVAFSISQTSDGGYIVAGRTASFGAGNYDFWVLKLNSDGSVAWQKSYGGPNYDEALSISQTSDDGYIVAGLTASFGAGNKDFWILKLNSDGSVAWQKSYGGPNDDGACSISQTSDGGYIVAGLTSSFGAGGPDFWILKLNSDGNIPNCGLINDSQATITNTTVTPENTNVDPIDTTVTPGNTSVDPQDTSATVGQQCFTIVPPTTVPTLTQWGMIILSLLLAGTAIFVLGRRFA